MEKPDPLPNPLCPRCGKPNECAPAKSGSFDTPCWCTSIRIESTVLAALGDERNACLCRDCATQS